LLRRLSVKDYLIFKDAKMEFGRGFNILSGETGAGKSLVVDAISLLLGGKVDWEAVRRRAYLELVLEGDEELASRLMDLGIPYEGEVVIRRTLNPQTRRSRLFINDMQVSARTVASLLSDYVFVGEQFSHRDVDDPLFQTEVLDRFAGIDLGEYPTLFSKYRRLKGMLKGLSERLEDLRSREDYLRFQLAELEKLNLREGEEEELLERKEELEEMVRAREWAVRFRETYPELSDGITRLLKDAPDRFREVLEDALSGLREILLSVEGEDYAELIEELDSINARLYEIGRLKRKYRADFSGLMAKMEHLRSELDEVGKLEREVALLEADLKALEAEMYSVCEVINERRRAALRRFEEYLLENLRSLGFEYVNPRVSLREGEFHPRGNTYAEIRLSTVPDVPPHRISKLSGGELARVALVLFSTGASRFRTLILDEIDVGVSPAIADRIGSMLKRISSRTQIVAITHQAFTALHGDTHFVVRRVSPTEARVERLSEEERWEELARMMGVKDAEVLKESLAPRPEGRGVLLSDDELGG